MKEITEDRTFRYERKFFISNKCFDSVKKTILYHPAHFHEIYKERYINNIYFDTANFTNFFDNIDGNLNREKFRIRWYGILFSNISKPILELKIKKGFVGDKKLYQIDQLDLTKQLLLSKVKEVIMQSTIDYDAKFKIQSQYPVMINRYKRKYFISSDKKFRVTLDTDQSFYRINALNNSFLHLIKDSSNVILELKYDVINDSNADMITRSLPFRITKSSKYARGIELLYL